MTGALALALSALAALPGVPAGATDNNLDTNVMMNAKYGVFFHYLPTANDIVAPDLATWNSEINNFDVTTFASQVAQTGARYAFITLGQNTGWLMSPNSKYDALTQSGVDMTSTRDLPMDIASALEPYGIKLMLYIPAGPPADLSPTQVAGFGVTTHAPGGNYWLTSTFRTKWSEVIQEWSDRYGDKVGGWWFDGAYDADQSCCDVGFNNDYAEAFSAAAKHGNPHSVVAFNNGVGMPARFASEDFEPLESNSFSSVPVPSSRWSPQNKQQHALSYLGQGWHDPAVAYDTSYLVNYLNDVSTRGGVTTIDMAIYKNGSLSSAQLTQMAQVRQRLRDARTVPHVDRTVTATSAHGSYPVSNVLDNDPSTFWHSQWSPYSALPQDITYDLGATYPVTKLRYTPKPGQNPAVDYTLNGNITGYTVSTSLNGTSFTTAATGSWADDGSEKTVAISGNARYVRLTATAGHNGYASAANLNVEYNASADNLALGKSATQSSTYQGTYLAGRAVDGNTDGDVFGSSVSHTNSDATAWWQVDLGASNKISEVVVWNRTDCCTSRLSDYYVLVSDQAFTSNTLSTLLADSNVRHVHVVGDRTTSIVPMVTDGRYVRIQLTGTNYLHLAEVQVIKGK